MSYIGNTNTTQGFTPAVDYFSGDGSTVAFTLSRPVASVAQVQATIANVPQNPSSAFSVSGNTITFTSAPLSGTNNIYVYYTSPITQVIAPSQGTVGTTQLQNGLVVNFADGSASAPSITNDGDTNTGIFFPAADTIAFSEGGVEAMRIDSSGNVGIGTASPTDTSGYSRVIDLNGSLGAAYYARTSGSSTNYTLFGNYGADGYINNRAAGNIIFYNNAAEAMRIDSGGGLLVNTTSAIQSTRHSIYSAVGRILAMEDAAGGSGNQAIRFVSAGNNCGTISTSTTATSYNTSSDYRLKENVQPMQNALDKVALLKPCTYIWKLNGSEGEGFIAHELAEVAPQCVNGEKDAVDEDGNPDYQSVDTSFLVATLTAAIQEQQAIIQTLTDRITALENK